MPGVPSGDGFQAAQDRSLQRSSAIFIFNSGSGANRATGSRLPCTAAR